MPSSPRRTPSTDRLALSRRSGSSQAAGLSLRIVGRGIYATHALPATGDVVIGREVGVDVHVDDSSISRRHAVLHLGDRLHIEDLGSANGTRVGGRRLERGVPEEIAPGTVVDLGSVMAVIQAGHAAARPRRVWSHGYFEARLEEECARGRGVPGAAFAVLRVRVRGDLPGATAEEALGKALREADCVATYGPGDYEVLLAGTPPEEAARLAAGVGVTLESLGAGVTTGLASFPRDGQSPEELMARACREVAGPGGDAEESSVVVEDPAMRDLHRLVAQVAVGSISVLLLGETGVGKEVIAEEIHARSRRADKPLLRLNCAALPEALLESELFGHEKHAFTGAAQAKAGLLETADGGTVFLDEIGELPLAVQVKLLRVLEAHEVQRLGALQPRKIDVRFVAATNRDLVAEIARGRFREDLYYRLDGISLVIPPLRERRAEIAPLARAFLRQATQLAGRDHAPRISVDALTRLLAYDWPGNIRELRNTVERAVLLCSGDTILPQHLPLEKMGGTIPGAPASAELPESPLKGQVDAVERQRILDVLTECGGNQSRAAAKLGISRSKLRNRIAAYGLPRPRAPRGR